MKNSDRKFYYVKDQLPESVQEFRRQSNDVYKANKRMPVSQRMEMNFQKGNLMINNQLYKKKLHPPKPKDILKVPKVEEELATSLELVESEPYEHEAPKFIAYTHSVRSIDDVNMGYMKTRLKHGEAQHIACVYQFANCRAPDEQDVIDDVEHGAGRAVLKVLKDEKMTDIAVYVVHYYGGVHIGLARFDIIQDLTG